MNNIFNSLLTNAGETLSVGGAITTMTVSLVFGLIIAFTYYKTQNSTTYQRSLALTLVMLPLILSVIIMFVGSNIARAFSLAGTLSIIRFRSAPGDAKDIAYIFFDIAAGLACGVGLYGYGALFVIILCITMAIMENARFFEKSDTVKSLKILIPENLNYEEAFDEILKKYTKSHRLEKIRTTDLGSLFELKYHVVMNNNADSKQFIDELRCRNGNLSIALTLSPQEEL